MISGMPQRTASGKAGSLPPRGSKSSLLNPGPWSAFSSASKAKCLSYKQTMIRLRLDPPILTVWFIFATLNSERVGRAPT